MNSRDGLIEKLNEIDNSIDEENLAKLLFLCIDICKIHEDDAHVVHAAFSAVERCSDDNSAEFCHYAMQCLRECLIVGSKTGNSEHAIGAVAAFVKRSPDMTSKSVNMVYPSITLCLNTRDRNVAKQTALLNSEIPLDKYDMSISVLGICREIYLQCRVILDMADIDQEVAKRAGLSFVSVLFVAFDHMAPRVSVSFLSKFSERCLGDEEVASEFVRCLSSRSSLGLLSDTLKESRVLDSLPEGDKLRGLLL